MPDYSKDASFQAAVVAADAGIDHLASLGIADAKALEERRQGQNNLQGHYNALVPLAVLVLRRNPSLSGLVRAGTSLAVSMTGSSSEARDAAVWAAVQDATKRVLAAEPTSHLGQMLSGRQLTVADAARYLSGRYGGTQASGGGGDTVLKRTLKLLAHMFES